MAGAERRKARLAVLATRGISVLLHLLAAQDRALGLLPFDPRRVVPAPSIRRRDGLGSASEQCARLPCSRDAYSDERQWRHVVRVGSAVAAPQPRGDRMRGVDGARSKAYPVRSTSVLAPPDGALLHRGRRAELRDHQAIRAPDVLPDNE